MARLLDQLGANSSEPLAHGTRALAMFLAYFLACHVGLSIDVTSGAASVWPPSGLLLGVLLLSDNRSVPSVLVGALLGGVAANLTVGFEAATSLGYTLINLGEGLTARWVIRRWAPEAPRLRQPSDVMAVLGFGAAAGAAGAVAAGLLATTTQGAEWMQVARTWFGADASGVAIIAPVILATADALRARPTTWRGWQVAEACLVAAAVVTAAVWTHVVKHSSPLDQATNPLLLLPLIAWAAVRFETIGAAWAVFFVNVFVVAGTVIGSGPLADLAPSAVVNLVLQARVGVTSMVALSLGAAVCAARRSALVHQQLALEVQVTRDAERGRLSHELHDDVAQKLAALKMHLQIAQLDTGSQDLPENGSVALVDDLLGTVRSLSYSLRPAPFDQGQLVTALTMLARSEGHRAGLAVLVDAPAATLSLPHEIELVCYRVVREALANVVKHASARHVAVSVSRQADALSISIADDGRGFDVGPTTRQAVLNGHLGLMGMRERLVRVGGRLTVDSRRGQGTTVNCSLPIGEAA